MSGTTSPSAGEKSKATRARSTCSSADTNVLRLFSTTAKGVEKVLDGPERLAPLEKSHAGLLGAPHHPRGQKPRLLRFADYVPPGERFAVFDNDGTLWCEKPLPVQLDFLLRRLRDMAAKDPSLTARQPWKAAAANDFQWLGDVLTKHYRGDDGDLQLMAAGQLQAYGEATIEEFEAAARSFLDAAQNPKLKRPYTKCVYQPMVDLLRYLTESGSTNYIVSGGGRDFMRVVAEPATASPPNTSSAARWR
jgi:phosphoserine phosphatase